MRTETHSPKVHHEWNRPGVREIANVVRHRVNDAVVNLRRQGYQADLSMCCLSCAVEQFDRPALFCYEDNQDTLSEDGALILFYINGAKHRTIVRAMKRARLNVVLEDHEAQCLVVTLTN